MKDVQPTKIPEPFEKFLRHLSTQEAVEMVRWMDSTELEEIGDIVDAILEGIILQDPELHSEVYGDYFDKQQ